MITCSPWSGPYPALWRRPNNVKVSNRTIRTFNLISGYQQTKRKNFVGHWRLSAFSLFLRLKNKLVAHKNNQFIGRYTGSILSFVWVRWAKVFCFTKLTSKTALTTNRSIGHSLLITPVILVVPKSLEYHHSPIYRICNNSRNFYWRLMENLEVPHRFKRGKSPSPRVVRKRSELSVKVCFVFDVHLLYFQSCSNQTWNYQDDFKRFDCSKLLS